MMKLIAINLSAEQTKTRDSLKAAMARNDNSDAGLMGLPQDKASQFNNNSWEVMLTLASKAAGMLADKAREGCLLVPSH